MSLNGGKMIGNSNPLSYLGWDQNVQYLSNKQLRESISREKRIDARNLHPDSSPGHEEEFKAKFDAYGEIDRASDEQLGAWARELYAGSSDGNKNQSNIRVFVHQMTEPVNDVNPNYSANNVIYHDFGNSDWTDEEQPIPEKPDVSGYRGPFALFRYWDDMDNYIEKLEAIGGKLSEELVKDAETEIAGSKYKNAA